MTCDLTEWNNGIRAFTAIIYIEANGNVGEQLRRMVPRYARMKEEGLDVHVTRNGAEVQLRAAFQHGIYLLRCPDRKYVALLEI